MKRGYGMRYLDYNSLYPYCMGNRQFPFGEFEIYGPEDLPSSFTADVCARYFGIIKCRVVPPTIPQLLYPVLPFRHPKTSHLLFPLCAACALELNHERDCDHVDSETRGWTGTFCTPELETALRRGYEVDYVVELWHFPESSDRIFKDFVRSLAKLKYANRYFFSFLFPAFDAYIIVVIIVV